MIVGHMFETYLTGTRVNSGPWEVTEHQVVTALNATKGWRPVSHRRQKRIMKGRMRQADWRAADHTVFVYIDGRPARKTFGIKPLQVRP